MNLLWTQDAWEEYLYWQKTDKRVVKKINALIKDAARSPFKGLGKPEPLKENLSGWWSRHITGEHRLVYRVQGEDGDRVLTVAQCRYHY
ncbi:YoeB toxin protein [Caenispirillum salinarum AK4]|uniref:Putative mRNA interferase YoeB n=1 Tax=Caenispirillum salinarum AK4 TaxID=1238182 RepID=K9GWZ0_9PROT|nr:Txe/YoeB family addiction module toxin [Caenispirillum salinarum]EKV29269.1 YoeB toxin protein [Caenispirillum salinarum AK4]